MIHFRTVSCQITRSFDGSLIHIHEPAENSMRVGEQRVFLVPLIDFPLDIQPSPGDKTGWSEQACEVFQKLTYNKRLYAELVKVNNDGKHEVTKLGV